MADTEDLKSSELKAHVGSTPTSGISELMYAHEQLLMTLRASNNRWLRWIWRNANAYYETWKRKYGHSR